MATTIHRQTVRWALCAQGLARPVPGIQGIVEAGVFFRVRSYGFEWHRASKNAGSHSAFFNPSNIDLTNSLTKQSPPFVSQSALYVTAAWC
ncbi:MAG: hypothetical protein F6K63_12155 [Moorea sp. SIO1G6]|uniref:hypothetical protein n=1 Tax=Moorena sp. SIO1G6 TaxID=2607840 RepID=UPI0013BEDC1D|nr:hypothetical protein [Moorena sp. SIO1G6]NET65094.1 hypothetical protein [Moorena sp. SIO1G6]